MILFGVQKEKSMKRLAAPMLLVFLGFLSACVTINVYFPAAAAEKAADRIIDQVYGGDAGKDKPSPATPAEMTPSSPASSLPGGNLLIGLLELMVPSVQAATPNFDIQTPAITQLTRSMEKHHKQLAPFYAQGGVGMTRNGEVAIRDLASIPLKDRNQVKKLVAAENRDRKALYREIARANGHPEWEPDIRATFARRWIARAPAGWWYQNNQGQWLRK